MLKWAPKHQPEVHFLMSSALMQWYLLLFESLLGSAFRFEVLHVMRSFLDQTLINEKDGKKMSQKQ